MMKLVALALITAAAACQHDRPAQTTPAPPLTSTTMSGTPTVDPFVDPTLPSWAPKSCAAYHAAVVRFVSCETDDAAKREAVRESYDSENKRWHDMMNVEQKAIDEVQTACAARTTDISAKTDPSCPQTTTTPPAKG
jgi:hypothetical protein